MGRIRKLLRKVSIPVAFIICVLSCLLVANSLTKVTVWFSQKNMNELEAEYVTILPLDMAEVSTGESNGNLGMQIIGDDQTPVYVEATGEGQLFVQEIAFTEEAKNRYDFYVSLDDIASLLWYSVCLCFAALAFYLWKLKKPFQILNQAVQKISENDLDFHIEYDGQDEFGRLCHAFEVMRQELEQNNKKMWDSVEERKRLNAAFAHDLRTPLTVMRGHTDMLLSTITEDVDTSGEMASSIRAISSQITRLNSFADTMGNLQRLEDYEPCRKQVASSSLKEMVLQTSVALFPNGQVQIHDEIKEQELMLDMEALAQICENVLSNAVRYVRETIEVSLKQDQDFVIITIEDDGSGFTKKDLDRASLAYYRGEKTQANGDLHFGLGLYISNILAEKLGGGLEISNGASGGARVQITVRCI